MADDLTRQKLELDIDIRLRWLWEAMEECFKSGKLDLEAISVFVRAAYGQGYVDSQKEEWGKLQRDNGYHVPERIDESR